MNPDIPQPERPSSIDCPSYGDLLRHRVLPKNLSDEIRAKIEAHIPLCKQCHEVSGEIQRSIEEGGKIIRREIDQIPFSELMAIAQQTINQGDAVTLSLIAERCIKYCTDRSINVDAYLAYICTILDLIFREGDKVTQNKIALFFKSKRPTD
ncbi:MAG: hypothetical protein AAB739_03830 [Patescibacteria group bacterium]|mgnify:CR=1 FL=1